MKKKIKLSIIIPTYKRNNKLILILKELSNQISNKANTEIIICDSEKDLNKKIKFFNSKKISIKYLSGLKNSNAIKRNFGIKNAKGENLILLDDDCLPSKNFIADYLKLFKKIKDNMILCGSVKYYFKKGENFKRYRQSRHFIIPKIKLDLNNYLAASKIVTMNMGMKNSELLKSTKYFNKDFSRYGFEDYEFGIRLINKGFHFIPAKPLIYHLDDRNFKSYLNKIYFLSRYASRVFQKISYQSWKTTVYYRIEKNTFFNILLNFKITYPIFSKLEKIIVYLEKFKFLYFPSLYRIAIFLSYCRGYYDRNYVRIKKKNYWYE